MSELAAAPPDGPDAALASARVGRLAEHDSRASKPPCWPSLEPDGWPERDACEQAAALPC